MKLITIFQLGLLFFPLSLGGQTLTFSAISPSGDSFQNGQASLSFTVGETATSTFANSKAILCGGNQHSFLTVVSSQEAIEDHLKLILYPLPATSVLFIEVPWSSEGLSVSIYNLQGAFLARFPLQNGVNQVHLDAYPVGTYLLKVFENNTFVKTFSIIKH
jgi:hypothetical protein